MTEFTTPANIRKSHPRRGEEFNEPDLVRVYRSSPETVQLQFRLLKLIIGADLPRSVANALGDALKAASRE